jgi:hypothetical protein
MVAGFDAVAQIVGNVMFGGDATAGGLLCGFVVVVVTYLGFMIVFRESHSGNRAVIPLALGILLSALVGWFPIWVILFIVIVLAFFLAHPYSESGHG